MNLGILISGRGSNLGAILDAIAEGRLQAHPSVVVSNRTDAGGLELAATHGVPTRVLPHSEHKNREEFDAAVRDALRSFEVDTVALAGFDRIVTPVLLHAFPGSVLNIHPALLPSFPGLHAQRQALEYGARVTGATVHFVDEKMDHGPILAQSSVPIFEDDTEQTLSRRILSEEHRLYPMALQKLSEGKTRIEGRRVRGGVDSR